MSRIIALGSNRNQAGKTTTALILKALAIWDFDSDDDHSQLYGLYSKKEFIKDFVNDPDHFSYIQSPFEIKKFAAKLYKIVSEMTGKSIEWLYANKETPLGEDWKSKTYFISDSEGGELFRTLDENQYNAQWEFFFQNFPHRKFETKVKLTHYTPRLLLNVIGTQLFRDQLHVDVHVNMLFSDFHGGSMWIIDDMRFPNEWKKIVELGGKKIFVKRGEDQKGMVEGKLSGYSFDYTIDNSGDIDNLIDSCIYVWDRIFR